MKKTLPILALIAVCLLAAFIRFAGLGRSAVRSDEINFLTQAARGQPLIDLWKNPPWMNQIPLADSIAIVWHWFRPGPPDERTVREPFALLGVLTVAGVAVWLIRRRGWYAGLLAGLWLALLPFHVYQSREAYYYIVVMAFSAGLTLQTAALFRPLRDGTPMPIRAFVMWTLWAMLTCLTHMSAWVVAGVMWLILLLSGCRHLPAPHKKTHVVRLLVSALALGVIMSRWVLRALAEMQKASEGDGHIGAAFSWVAPRVLPFYTAGANVYGYAVTLAILLGALVMLLHRIKSRQPADPLYRALSVVVISGFLSAYAYIGLVGGGVGKITYFSSLLPVFIVWCVCTIDSFAARWPGRSGMMVRVAVAFALAAILWPPAQAISRLDGKPVPYKVLRAWMDQNLEPGSVVTVDRWFEPWNEMARYAPSNVVVTFTVPDEPYENYVQLRWRDVTREAIESGKINAFIRLTRNHEERAGLWTWPETYFARRTAVTNETGLWLREHGYAISDDFYAANTNRLIIEIFYDLREDAIARKRAAGEQFGVFFNQTIPYEKSGPMGIFRFQTQQFMDWRALGERGELEVYNLTDAPADVTLQISAVAPREAKVISSNGKRFQFPAGQMQQWNLGPLTLAPGRNVVAFEDPRWGPSQSPLLISSVEVK